MPRFQLAHIREQGVDIMIVPLSDDFEVKSDSDRAAIIDELQVRARAAGLAGTVVPVWVSSGTVHFIAPPNWHPFFRSLNMQFVRANLNRELYW